MPSHCSVAYLSRNSVVIPGCSILLGTPNEPCVPPPVNARRRDVAKFEVSFKACGSSLVATVVVTICSLDRIASALPFSPLSLNYVRMEAIYWNRSSYFLSGSGRTHVSRSAKGSGFGIKSMAITKLLAEAYKSAHDEVVMTYITDPNEATCA